MSTFKSEVELLSQLVLIESVSGSEERIGRFVDDGLSALGLVVERGDDGVLVRVDSGLPGPTLALVSHLDTVPVGDGWTRPPFDPQVENGCLFGRGSGDAKASVAAMLTAALDIAEAGGPRCGQLLVLLGYGEETKHTSMPALSGRAGSIDAAVVGEPTNLRAATAQRGLLMIDLVAHGDQRHAGYAGDGAYVSAITTLARDLVRLDGLIEDRVHPQLGTVTVTATMLEAGVSRNVTAPTARAVLDVRSTPSYDHDELAATLRARLASDVVVTSDRLLPCATPLDSRLLEAARQVRPDLATFGSPTCSDWVFLRHLDVFKCGPGTSRRSHTADEHVDLAEVTAARVFYRDLVHAYLRADR